MIWQTEQATAPLALFSNVTLHYPDGPQILDGLDWQIFPGQVVGLLGRNGAGKTSLIETMLGLREPQFGRCTLFGSPALAIDDAIRARIGYVPQRSDLFESFSATQLLRYFRSFYPRWNDAKVEDLMVRWDIPRDRLIGKLSHGQQQRLSIIRALAHEPDLLLLDEPVSSLDPAGRRDFLRELIEQVLNRQTSVVFSTHILSDLERVAFDIAFLSAGKIRLQAPIDDLLDQICCLTASRSDLDVLIAQAGITPIKRQKMAVDIERMLICLPDKQIVPAGMRMESLNLEDLFMELT